MIVAKRVKAGKLFGDLVIDQKKHPFELDLEEGRCTVKKSDFDKKKKKTWYKSMRQLLTGKEIEFHMI